jgi:hypothetical protein
MLSPSAYYSPRAILQQSNSARGTDQFPLGRRDGSAGKASKQSGSPAVPGAKRMQSKCPQAAVQMPNMLQAGMTKQNSPMGHGCHEVE